MMFGYDGGWPAWEIALMWIGMIAFLGVLIRAAYTLITNPTRRPGLKPRASLTDFRRPRPPSARASSAAWQSRRPAPVKSLRSSTTR